MRISQKISLTAVWQLPIGWLYVNSGLALARRDLAAAGAWPIGRGGSQQTLSDPRPGPSGPCSIWALARLPLLPPRVEATLPWLLVRPTVRATPETGCRDLCTRGSTLFYFTTTGEMAKSFFHWTSFHHLEWEATGVCVLACKDVNCWVGE